MSLPASSQAVGLLGLIPTHMQVSTVLDSSEVWWRLCEVFSLPVYLPVLLVWCTPQAQWEHIQSHHLDCHVCTYNMNTIRACINPHELHVWPSHSVQLWALKHHPFSSIQPVSYQICGPPARSIPYQFANKAVGVGCAKHLANYQGLTPTALPAPTKHIAPSEEPTKLVMHCLLLVSLTWLVPTTFLPFTCKQTVSKRTCYILFPECAHQSAVSWFFLFTDGNNTCPLPVILDLPLVSVTFQKW